ncbi:MAG: HlyC/CorC family transporter [Chloroflexaceae bacterium]|nr:HlyC/CorC family transporter [Chloroflexaceae bacterium]
MDPDPSTYAVLIGGIMLLFGVSAADAAFTSLSWRRITNLLADVAQRSPRLERMLDQPEQIKATLSFASHLTLLVLTALLAGWLVPYGMLWQLGLTLIVLVVFAILLPRALVARQPQSWIPTLLPLVSLLVLLLNPVVRSIFAPFQPRQPRNEGDPAMAPATPDEINEISEELRALVSEAAEAAHDGDQDEMPEELRLLSSIAAMSETEVREIMIPRVDIVALDADTPFEQVLDVVIHEQHSRIPVYDETIDDVIGILYAKDLLPLLHNGQRDCTLRELIRQVYFVPESVTINSLLKDMQRSQVHLAIIRDEYGGTAGLVTIEDLLEEIVGDINDEYDDEPELLPVDPKTLIVHANVPLDDLNELTTLRLESDDADRVGGLIYAELGRVPLINEQFTLDWAMITVVSGHGRRPEKFRIELSGGHRLRDAPTVEPVLEPGTAEQSAPSAAPIDEQADPPTLDHAVMATRDLTWAHAPQPALTAYSTEPHAAPTHTKGYPHGQSYSS